MSLEESYVEKMDLEGLALHYKKFNSLAALDELRRRDRLSKMTYDERMGQRFEETDKQMTLEFPQSEGNNTSVKPDDWHAGYEAGFVAGKNAGQKERSFKGTILGYLSQQAEQFGTIGEVFDKEIEADEIISGHGKDNTGSGNTEAESHRD